MAWHNYKVLIMNCVCIKYHFFQVPIRLHCVNKKLRAIERARERFITQKHCRWTSSLFFWRQIVQKNLFSIFQSIVYVWMILLVLFKKRKKKTHKLLLRELIKNSSFFLYHEKLTFICVLFESFVLTILIINNKKFYPHVGFLWSDLISIYLKLNPTCICYFQCNNGSRLVLKLLSQ